MIFSYFSLKIRFYMECKLFLLETICIKCQIQVVVVVVVLVLFILDGVVFSALV